MKNSNPNFVFRFIILFLTIVTINIFATEPPSNIISSTGKSIHLDFWQIAIDREPKNSIQNTSDTLWQSFEPTLDDERYSVGNWLIRTNIVIKDSLSSKEVLGLFPLNLVTAYEIYWDGIKIAENGKIGNDKTEDIAGSYNFSFAFPSNLVTRGEHTLVFRISNHNNYSSWKWFYGYMVIGKYDYLLQRIAQLYYRAFFITGILFIPFLFNLFLYIARKRKVEHLLFSIICLILIVDSLTMMAPILLDTRTTFVYWQYYVYQLFTLLFTALFPAFFIYLFSFPKKIIGIVIVTTLFIFLFFTNIENRFNIMILTVLIISSIITIWALYKRREESVIIFIGIIAAWAAYYFNLQFCGISNNYGYLHKLFYSKTVCKKRNGRKRSAT